jgi:hypothetical protein
MVKSACSPVAGPSLQDRSRTWARGGSSWGRRRVKASILLGFTLHQDFHPGGIVAHPAGKVQCLGEVPDVGAEADALDDAGDTQVALHPEAWMQLSGIQ